jgi:hypothetical protein
VLVTKTLKALKTATIWNCIFCFSCVLSTICFAIDEYYDVSILRGIGIITVYGWMVNPFAIISCFRCLKVYLLERKDPDYKQIIGRKRFWIFIWPIITTVLWLFGGLLFVKFTGGV